MTVIINPYNFTSCEDCVHHPSNEHHKRNCDHCKHKTQRESYFYHVVYYNKGGKNNE